MLIVLFFVHFARRKYCNYVIVWTANFFFIIYKTQHALSSVVCKHGKYSFLS